MLSVCLRRMWPRLTIAVVIVALFLRDVRAIGIVTAVFVVMVGVEVRTYSRSRAKHVALERKFGPGCEAILAEKLAELGLDVLIWRRWIDVEFVLEQALGTRRLYD